MEVLCTILYQIFVLVIFSAVTGGENSCSLVVDKSTAVVYLPFDTLTNGEFADGTNTTNTLQGSLSTVTGVDGNAASLDGLTAVSITESRDACFGDPAKCTNGFTVAFWIYNVERNNDELEPYAISSGSQTADSYGFMVLLETGSDADDRGLLISISTLGKKVGMTDVSWKAGAKDGEWVHMAVTFHNEEMKYYENGELVFTGTMTDRNPVITETEFNHFGFGAPNNHLDSQDDKYYGVFHLDEFIFWDSLQDAGFILNLYQSYFDLPTLPTCDLHLRCVDAACVTSCKGLSDGDYQSCVGCNVYVTCASEVSSFSACSSGERFDSTQEACVQTSSTCTEFDATDKCLPRDSDGSGSECSLIIDKNTATVWLPFDTLTDSEFSDGTYRTETLRGSAQTVEGVEGGALSLDGSTVLSLGDYRSSCFWDPGQCDAGFTLAFWVYNARANSDEIEPYLFSNGGQTSASFGVVVLLETGTHADDRGLLISVASKQKKATFTQDSWKANAKDGEWKHLAVTLDGDEVSLYEDGQFVELQTMADRDPVLTDTEYNLYVFGAPNRNLDTPSSRAEAYVDDFIFWDTLKDAYFISNLYYSYGFSALPDCDTNLKCVDVICLSTCVDTSDEVFQSCVGCNVYATCNSGSITLSSCRNGTRFDTSDGSCVESSTCTGDDASEDCLPDGCSDNPCSNGGDCSMVTGGWVCDCDTQNTGYSGPTCQTVALYCIVNGDSDCNDGSCVDEENAEYSCDCNEGYKGDSCDTETYCKMNENNSDVCMNGGTCVDDEDKVGHSCTCADGFAGDNCELASFCSDNPDKCENGGTCVDEGGLVFVRCDCQHGYEGETCDEEDECVLNNPCENGGTCSYEMDGVTTQCACTDQWLGESCDVENPCFSQPCEHQGTCAEELQGDGSYSYVCDCTEHFNGVQCEDGPCQTDQYTDQCGPSVDCINHQDGTCEVPVVIADVEDDNGACSQVGHPAAILLAVLAALCLIK